jgi:hypothetical protein
MNSFNETGVNHPNGKYFSEYAEKTPNGKYKIDCCHPTKNGDVNPHNAKYDDDTKYWFECDDCSRDFKLSIFKIMGDGLWCPHCDNKSSRFWYVVHAICDCISIMC